MEHSGGGDAVVTLLDGADESRHAARHAAEVAQRVGTRLVVLAPVAGSVSGTRRAGTEVGAATRAAALEEAEHRFHGLRSEMNGEESAELRATEIQGSVADTVLDLLERERCLTVVLPRRGPGLVMRLLGDDTQDIVKRSPVPVTLVPARISA